MMMDDRLAVNGGKPSVSTSERKIWPFYEDKVEDDIARKIRSGEVYATRIDRAIENLEESFVKRLCVDHYALFCGSGTSALMTAYFALGLDRGAEVIVQSNTFRATATPLFLLNLVPVLCDSNSDGTLSVDDVSRKITTKTQAIVVTHTWGQATDIARLKQTANKHSIALVEDCSHAHGVEWKNRQVGTFGDVSAFSLGTKKLISGGNGGMLITRNRDVYERAALFSQPTLKAQTIVKDVELRAYLESGLGVNFRGSPLAALLAQNHLDRLDETIRIKNNNLAVLERIIRQEMPEIKPIKKSVSHTRGTWYAYPCEWTGDYATRDEIVKALSSEGVLVRKAGDVLHEMAIFRQNKKSTPLTTYSADSRNEEDTYSKLSSLSRRLIIWSTTEMYEPAENVLESYSKALRKVRYWLRQKNSGERARSVEQGGAQ